MLRNFAYDGGRFGLNHVALSTEISYALRHAPGEYGLTLDEQGWVAVEDLLAALRKQKVYTFITDADIADMIATSQKKRHEIVDGRIRALYGHSTGQKIEKEAATPPDVLYHGTAHRFLNSIQVQGLISKDRQYVHLSEDRQTAQDVGRRRDDSPVILTIDAAAACKDGIRFYMGNDMVWLADSIPVQYICFPSSCSMNQSCDKE